MKYGNWFSRLAIAGICWAAVSGGNRLYGQEKSDQSANEKSKSGVAAESADGGSAGGGSEKTAAELIQDAYRLSTEAGDIADFSRVLVLCEQALKTEPTDEQKTYLNQLRSWTLVERSKLTLKQAGQDDESNVDRETEIGRAVDDCDRAIELNPGYWKAYVQRAKCRVERNEYRPAVDDLGVAIRQNPAEASLWFNRAELLFVLEQYEVAIADYSEALKLQKDDLQAMTGRAHCYRRLGKHDLARIDYDNVVELAPRNPVGYLNRAELHLLQGDFESAGADYRAALTRDQSLAAAYRGVAWMYATSEKANYYNPTIADRSIKRAIELVGKETTDNLVVLAAAQAASGEYSMARDTMKRVRGAKKLSPETAARLKFLENRKWYRAGTGEK